MDRIILAHGDKQCQALLKKVKTLLIFGNLRDEKSSYQLLQSNMFHVVISLFFLLTM